jgi:hypothetical protein
LRRNIEIRMKHHEFARLTKAIGRERDQNTLRSLGSQLRSLQFDPPSRDLEGLFSPNEIQERGDALLELMDKRWRELLALSQDEEASNRCQSSREDFSSQTREWQMVHRLEELLTRWRDENPVTLEELDSLAGDLTSLTVDAIRQYYGSRIDEIRTEIQALQKMKEAGVPVASLKSSRFSASQLKGVGYRVADLREHYSIKEIHEAGFSLQEMKEAEVPPQDLKPLGYSVAQLKQVGYTAMEMKGTKVFVSAYTPGTTPGTTSQTGYSLQELRQAYSLEEIRVAFSLEEMRAGECSVTDLKSC